MTRIGTWNLQGRRWGRPQHRLVGAQQCDVWLFTEAHTSVSLPDWHSQATAGEMAPERAWAAVWSRQPLTELPDPHPATAAALVDGVTYWSGILPWRSCGGEAPWRGQNHGERTQAALHDLLRQRPAGPHVWGGDWNHALGGKEYAGSAAGRAHLLTAVDSLGLTAVTAGLAHHLPGLLSIDHIAVPFGADVTSAQRVPATEDGKRLSDHDVYVVEIA